VTYEGRQPCTFLLDATPQDPEFICYASCWLCNKITPEDGKGMPKTCRVAEFINKPTYCDIKLDIYTYCNTMHRIMNLKELSAANGGWCVIDMYSLVSRSWKALHKIIQIYTVLSNTTLLIYFILICCWYKINKLCISMVKHNGIDNIKLAS
jgi:hypothetical protein